MAEHLGEPDARVPRRPVRRRAGLGPLPGGLRRPRAAPGAAERRATSGCGKAGAPDPALRNPIGYGMAAPTVVDPRHRRAARRYLRPLFTGEEIWCQLFSEPGAGSDVAGLADHGRARRRRVGRQRPEGVDHARPHRPLRDARRPHRPRRAQAQGMTYFVVDMHAPGVEVRPLRQMTGEAEFNEVYFTDVAHPRRRTGSATSATAGGWR